MQLLVASDIHYNLRQLDWLLSVANDFDVVIVAGDHLDISASVPLQAQWVVILEYVKRLADRTAVIVCSGNHDLATRNAYGEKAAEWILDGRQVGAFVDWDTFDRGGLRITVCPWWDGPRTRDDVASQLARDSLNRPKWWAWVYHPPPSESAVSRGRTRDFGDADLRAWIDRHRPDLVFTGHVHESPFVPGGSWVDRIDGTLVFNAGRLSTGAIPNHLIVDLDASSAFWYAGGETGEIPLEDPAQ